MLVISETFAIILSRLGLLYDPLNLIRPAKFEEYFRGGAAFGILTLLLNVYFNEDVKLVKSAILER